MESHNVSRRGVIRILAAVPLAFRALRASAVDAQSVEALELQNRYRKHPNGARRCMQCANYTRIDRVSGSCGVLQTTVNWEGWCSQWTARRAGHAVGLGSSGGSAAFGSIIRRS